MAQENQTDEKTTTDQPGAEGSAAQANEVEDLRARLLRWQADFQNLQRRTAREVLEARQRADADFAKDLIDVLDHFDQAVAVDPDKVDARTILTGVKITHDEFKKLLAKRGIEAFDPTGQPFDPHQHEAVMQEARAGVAPMTVLQTFQLGYKAKQQGVGPENDRVLRPAKVKVSK